MSEQATMTAAEAAQAEAGAQWAHGLASAMLALLKERSAHPAYALCSLSLALGTLVGRTAADHEHLEYVIGIASDHVRKVAEAVFVQQAADDIAALIAAPPGGNA